MEDDNSLYHYGVIGMRWGKRKYQNKYGALNTSGKVKTKAIASEHKKLLNIDTLSKKGARRISNIEKEYKNLTGKSLTNKATTNKATTKVAKKKVLSDMSNEELAAINTRRQLETTYMSFQPKPRVSKGKVFVAAVVTKVILPEAIKAGRRYTAKALMGKSADKDVEKDISKIVKDIVKD